jgi:hypothetical protein
MQNVREKEERAQAIAHLLDDVLRVPGTHVRIGADPLLGLIPMIGDTIATVLGATILILARQTNVPWRTVSLMAFNQLKNGLLGAVPFLGDMYSFYFKSNAVNTALLLRTVKHGEEGQCSLIAHPLKLSDIVGLAILILPIVVIVSLSSFYFWHHNISYVALLFPSPYLSR